MYENKHLNNVKHKLMLIFFKKTLNDNHLIFKNFE